MTDRRLDADVCVVGAGPAGCAAAMAASRAGATVTMVHHREASRLGATERIAPHATAVLSELGLLARLDARITIACPDVRSQWRTGNPVTHHAIFDPHGGGWTVDRAQFDGMLRKAAVEQGVEIICGAVTWLERLAQGWKLTISREQVDPLTFGARNVVLANGRSGWLARQFGASITRRAREVALLASFDSISSAWADDPLLLVEALPGGWAYGLPTLVGGALAGVCLPAASSRGAARDGLRTLWERWYAHSVLLRDAIGTAAPRHIEGRPAQAQRRWPVSGKGWALAGDAACAPSPLSGHGVYFALESGRFAGLAVVQGERAILSSYARWAQGYWTDHEQASAQFYGDVIEPGREGRAP